MRVSLGKLRRGRCRKLTEYERLRMELFDVMNSVAELWERVSSRGSLLQSINVHLEDLENRLGVVEEKLGLGGGESR